MTISNNVSFMAQSTSQINRLNDLRMTFDDLQRQVTTQKKYENFSGFGTDSLGLQRLRTSQSMTEAYVKNIDTVSDRMDMMTKVMTSISGAGSNLLHTISLQGGGGTVDMSSINQLARQGLKFVEDLINQSSNGRYLFAGSDATAKPFVDDTTLNANFTSQINSWLAGGITNAQLTNTTDGYNAANLGLSPGLAASGAVTARVDENLDIDYTVKADEPGFKDIIRALTFAANMKYPDPAAGDLATPAQFDGILSHIVTSLTQGVQTLDDSTKQLSSKFDLLKSIKDSHASDMNLMLTQIDKLENVDSSTAIINMQSLQNQLTASYQVTKIVSQMSLVNFM